MTLLDDWMPEFDAASRHALDVAAEPAHTYEAARAIDLAAPPLVKLLMGLRAAPALAARALSRRKAGQSPRTASVDGARDAQQVALRPGGQAGLPFTLLDETPGSEFVMGLAGRFWTPSGGVVAASADAFRRPPPPGLAHAAWNFRVAPRDGGCTIVTETRVRCGDAATRARFLRYWRVVRFGSGMIRRSILRDIRRKAEG